MQITPSLSQNFSVSSLSRLSCVSEGIHDQTCLLKWGHLYYLKSNLSSQSAVAVTESMRYTPGGISLFTIMAACRGKLLLMCNMCETGGWPRGSQRGVVINQLALGHVSVCVWHLVMMNLPRGAAENCGLHPSELLHSHELEEKKNLVKAKWIHLRVVKYIYFNSSIQGQQAAT